MCLFPRITRNKRYVVNKKNGGDVPKITDYRMLFVPIGCGKCMECKAKKAREWSIRLQEEIKVNRNGKFVTLTFSDESIRDLAREINIEPGYELDNAIAKLATRRFLERWRKKHKISVKHWLVTELGQGKHGKYRGTENLHLHGLLFTNEIEDITTIWKYGFVYIGEYVNNSTVNYSTKYFSKSDKLHPGYTAIILTSPGMGNNYLKSTNAKNNKYQEGETREYYTLDNGKRIGLPIYYRNGIYTEEERNKLWKEKLDQETRYVLGEKISTKNGPEAYYKALAIAQRKNKTLGFGDSSKDWSKTEYENERRKININKRIANAEKREIFEHDKEKRKGGRKPRC